MRSKKLLAGVLAAAAVINLSVSAAADDISENDEPKTACFDPDIMEYVFEDGTVVEPVRSEIFDDLDVWFAALPEKYDSREAFAELELEFPEVRNQNPTGTCWVHAALAAMEIRGIAEGLFDSGLNVNFSEAQIAYFSTVSSPDPTDRYYGDNYGLCPNKVYSLLALYKRGGNVPMATGILARGIGAYDEAHDPSLTISSSDPTPVIDEELRYASDYYVSDCEEINPDDTDAIKTAVMEYGAVTMSYYNSPSYHNGASYYCPSGSGSNHAVSVIGWDDSYSRDNFSNTPDTDGAWLCRNSWGRGFGDGGYFYISYCEPELKGIYTVKAVPKTKYSTVYGYDGACPIIFTYPKGYSIANIFTADKSEYISAAAFYTVDEAVDYTVKVYTDITDTADPESGELMINKSGTIPQGGYHTIDLNTSVFVDKGSKFSVVLETSDTKMYADNNNTSAGQSFHKKPSAEQWTDTYNGSFGYYCTIKEKHNGPVNVCLRALTTDIDDIIITEAPASASVIGGTGCSFTAKAEGTGLDIKWQYKNGTIWTDIPDDSNFSVKVTKSTSSLEPGAKSTLSIFDTTRYQDCSFRCIITDSSGRSIATDPAVLTFLKEDEISSDMIEAVPLAELPNYVNYFTALYDDEAFVLTPAQLRAVELVLDEDYS